MKESQSWCLWSLCLLGPRREEVKVFFLPLPLSISHPAVLIKRNRPWNLTGPLSWFIYQVYSAPEWWLCVIDTQGWVFAEQPLPLARVLLLLFLHHAPSPWHQSSRLTPGLSSRGTAQASAKLRPNECRAGLLLLPLPFARTWLTRPLNTDRLRFTFPRRPRPLLRVSEVVLRCSSYPYATAVCFALGELPVTLPKPHSKRLLQTSHAIQNKKKKSLINLIQKERKKERHNNKKKNTPFRASCCRELQKVLLLFVPKWLLLVTENTCLLLFGFRRRVPTC